MDVALVFLNISQNCMPAQSTSPSKKTLIRSDKSEGTLTLTMFIKNIINNHKFKYIYYKNISMMNILINIYLV